jgi:hypothetical protein
VILWSSSQMKKTRRILSFIHPEPLLMAASNN